MKTKNAIHNTGTIHAGMPRVRGTSAVRVAKGRRPAQPYPRNSIGANVPKRSYVKYLVERFHRLREADVFFGKDERLRYAELFKNIETKFKTPTYFIPEARFEELVDYLQSRIDRTMLGRRNTSQGTPNVESFDEYKMKLTAAVQA